MQQKRWHVLLNVLLQGTKRHQEVRKDDHRQRALADRASAHRGKRVEATSIFRYSQFFGADFRSDLPKENPSFYLEGQFKCYWDKLLNNF
jgi:hypothetical protein